jgi:hypothetical protein
MHNAQNSEWKGIICYVQVIRTNNSPKKKQGLVVALLQHFIYL